MQVLNAILDAEAAERAGWSLTDLAAAFLTGGARFLQVRAKLGSSAWLLDQATRVVALAKAVGATVIVNDRADVARLSGASGVHVGQEDLDVASVRTIVGPHAIVGLSTHSLEQMVTGLEQPVTYLAIGPVFSTSTKSPSRPAIGLDLVRQAAELAGARRIPLVAIGGITLDRAADVIDAGASSVAVVGDLVTSGDPGARVRAYLDRLAKVGDV